MHLVVKCGPINWPFQGRSNETDLEQTQSTPLVDGVCCVATLVATRLEPKIFVHEFEWPWRQKWQKCRFFFGPFPVSRNFVFRRAEKKKRKKSCCCCLLFVFFLERKMSCVTVDRLKSRHSLRSFLSDTRWFHNSVQHLQKWHGWQYIQFRSPVKSQHRSTWYVANNAAPAVVIR